MLKPMEYIPDGVYWSNKDGSARTYFFDLPFGATTKHLTSDLKVTAIDESDNGTKVTLSVVQALTRDIADADWPVLGGVALIEATTVGYHVKTTSDDYGPMVRVALTVAEDDVTPSVQKSVQCSARASGKPF